MGFLAAPLWKGSKERITVAVTCFHLEVFPVLLLRIAEKKNAILMIIAMLKTSDVTQSRGPSTKEP
jgi:hypothetical protein